MTLTTTAQFTIRTSALLTHIADSKGNLITVQPIRGHLTIVKGSRVELLATADSVDIYVVKITQPQPNGTFDADDSIIRSVRNMGWDTIVKNSMSINAPNVTLELFTHRVNNDIEFVERCIIALSMRNAFSEADEELGTRLGRWLLGLNDADKARYMPKGLVHPKVDQVMRQSLEVDKDGNRETSLNGARRICINSFNILVNIIKR